MTKQSITKLIKQLESETFEKKPSLSDIGRIVEVVCSFANNKGGKILVGVSDKGKVMGIDIGKNTIERLTDTIVKELHKRQKKAVEYIKKRGKISNEEYQKLNNANKKTSTRDLTDLVRKSVLVKIGKTGRGTYYIVRGHKGDIKGT